MIVRELLTKLGFDADTDALERFEGSMERVRQLMTWTVAAAGALQGAVVLLTNSVARKAEEVEHMARALGLTTDQYQELHHAMGQFGVDSNDLADTLSTLADRAQDAADGMQSYIDDFALVGLSVDELRNKRPIELLDAYADAVAATQDPTRRTASVVRILGDDLGRRLAPMLQDGSAGLARLRREAHEMGVVMDKEGLEQAKEYRKQLKLLLAVFAGLKEAVGVGLMPALMELIQNTRAWILANKELLRQRIHAFVEGFGRILTWLWGVLTWGFGVMDGVIRWLGGFERAIHLTTVALGVLIGANIISGLMALSTAIRAVGLSALFTQASIAAVPLAIAAAIALVILLIQDFIGWMRGDKSFIGAFLGPFDKFTDKFFGFFKTIGKIASGISEAISKGFTAAFEAVDKGFDATLKAVTRAWDALKKVWDGLKQVAIKVGLIDEQSAPGLSGPTDRRHMMPGDLEGDRFMDFLNTPASGSAMAGAARPSVVSNTTINAPITVNGAQDPKAVSREVGRELDRRFRAAQGDFALAEE